MERHTARVRCPRTLDFTQGLTTAVLVEHRTGASRGTAQARTEAFRFHCSRRLVDQCGRDMVEGCRLTIGYQAKTQGRKQLQHREILDAGVEKAHRQLTAYRKTAVEGTYGLASLDLWVAR